MEGQQTIGIVGGGQLGRMLTLAALPLGYRVVVINPSPNSPASQAGAEEIVADLYNANALQKLAEQVDFITVEIEHLDADTLRELARTGTPVNPAPSTIRLIQDKLAQKHFLERAGVPVAPFMEISNQKTAETALKKFGGKMLLKTRYGAYDGRGNMVVKSSSDIKKALGHFKDQKLYAEQAIDFAKELAIMIARDYRGNIKLYPVVETIHERNICIEVLAPAPINDKARRAAERIARQVAKLLDGAGTFGIEMFLTKSNEVLVNEIAPRVHNSGHYTTEASRTSQFEQHIRAISELPLGSTDMVVQAAVMINILGERNGPAQLEKLGKTLETPHTNVHVYGKSPTKVDRKMGHITATGPDINQARRRARQARRQISI